jgi:hypothetical protein
MGNVPIFDHNDPTYRLIVQNYSVAYVNKLIIAYAQPSLFSSEAVRLQTFHTHRWDKLRPTPNQLARHGFYLTPQGATRCAFCTVTITHWGVEDTPSFVHTYYSNNCPLLCDPTLSTNIPISAQPAHDNANTLRFRLGQVTSEIIALANNARDLSNHVPIDQVIRGDVLNDGYRTHYRPTRTPRAHASHMATEVARYRSYNGCYPALRMDLIKLVRAGFFYAGQGDLVHCFSCGGGLEDWELHMCPWMEHAKFYPECHHLKNVRGALFVDNTQQRFNEEIRYLIPAVPRSVQPARLPLTCYGCGNRAEVLMFMCFHYCACTSCVKEMTSCPKCYAGFIGYVRAYLL